VNAIRSSATGAAASRPTMSITTGSASIAVAAPGAGRRSRHPENGQRLAGNVAFSYTCVTQVRVYDIRVIRTCPKRHTARRWGHHYCYYTDQ
jgi:hypothetical protein